MDPQTRTILKLTTEDAVFAAGIFQMSMGDEVEPRRSFIEQNAKFEGVLDNWLRGSCARIVPHAP